MVYFSVCDTLHSHPKALRAGNEALGLWVRVGSWAGQQLTDGDVPSDLVAMYGSADLAERLVRAGLWVPSGSGFHFHQWEQHQRSRGQVEAHRKANQARQQRYRDARNAVTDGVSNGVDNASSNAKVLEGQGKSLRPKPYRDFRVSNAVTQPGVSALCEHGRDGEFCPFCSGRLTDL